MPTVWWSYRVPTGLAVFVVLVLALAAPRSANAGIVMVTGNGDILTPGVDKTGALKNFFQDTGANPKVHGWNEQQNVTLSQDVYVDLVSSGTYNSISDLGTFNQFKINSGTRVSSHLLYFDPLQSRSVSGVTFTFDETIIGVIVESDRFFRAANGFTDYFIDSDFLANPLSNPAVNYPSAHFTNRGLELGNPDTITVFVVGKTITIDMYTASNPGDQIRIITAGSNGFLAIPAPAGVLLALAGAGSFSGFAGVNWLRRRKRK